MSYGISIYFGLDNTKEENIRLLKEAHKLKFIRIFTSFQIPEANYSILKTEAQEFFKLAKEYDMDIITDISPNTFNLLDLKDMDLSGLSDMGVKTIRIDFGYREEEISKMTNNPYGIKIQLNASTVTEKFFEKLDIYLPNYKNVDALHNFYPRVGTGISEECMKEKNAILSKRGIMVSAFVQSNNKRRGPLFDGLPTLEDHRGLEVREAANHLFVLGNQSVFIGDSLPSMQELEDLSGLRPDVVELFIELKECDNITLRLLSETYTQRQDEAREAIRASESRLLLNGDKIKSLNTANKSYGDITIDNQDYKRYMGELEILKVDQKGDYRTNVVACVLQKNLYLLKYIKGGKKFHFNIINK
ncbi:MupG family TIM beta-alpha barrel fold protein [Clostridium sp.]|uniref:MupG family TIM beta-alpha barrel fold protein n=1 Tax=Clostridium sp. TaxID=1506 RepID=UPI002629E6AA|nr:MupG family TIM beta-alpha barrel fold protein [uncultured Clostridium sp.]